MEMYYVIYFAGYFYIFLFQKGFATEQSVLG